MPAPAPGGGYPGRYLLRRVLGALVTLWAVTLVGFLVAHAVPASPARMVAGRFASPAEVRRIAEQLGLGRPLIVQYGIYLGDLLRGNLGTSYATGLPVWTLIRARLGYTAGLASAGLVAELLIGLPLGVLAAGRRRTRLAALLMAASLLGLATPSFITGFALLYLFAFRLSLFPLQQYHGPLSVVLPALTIGIYGGGYYARMLRAALVEALGREHVLTARGKGLSEAAVLWRHALRDAAGPLLTLMALDLGAFMGGVLVVETVFGWPGVGLLVYNAIGNDDIPVILGVTLVAAVFVVLANLAVDLVYPCLDPRIVHR